MGVSSKVRDVVARAETGEPLEESDLSQMLRLEPHSVDAGYVPTR
jgi:hypothetical protein